MKFINDNTFSKFVRNELSFEEMKKIENELILSGSANASFLSLLSDYFDNDIVAELIGEDEDEEQSVIERKKVIEVCKKMTNSSSFLANNLNFYKMENIQITKEELLKVTERYNEIEKTFVENESLKNNLLNAYLSVRSNIGKEDAIILVDKLLDGCETLTRMYNEALSKGEFDVRKEIESIGEGMSIEERFHLIVNVLAMVENINTSSYTSLENAKEKVAKAIEDYNAATTNPTQADCDAMLDALAEAIENNTLVLSGTEKVSELFDKAKLGKAEVVDFASEQYDDARVKVGMALAMWLEYEDGHISSFPEHTTPEAVAIGAATAVEQTKVATDVAAGRKTIDVAIKCLKILGGVALTCLLVFGGILAGAYIGAYAAAGLLSLLGSSVLAVIVTMVAVGALLCGVTGIAWKAGVFIMEKAEKVYDVIVEKLRETVIPAIRKYFDKICTWIRNRISLQPVGTVAINP